MVEKNLELQPQDVLELPPGLQILKDITDLSTAKSLNMIGIVKILAHSAFSFCSKDHQTQNKDEM